MTSGRGYCSLEPRYQIAQRFGKSGKNKLVLLLLSDHDPDGEEISASFARSLRDDFDIPDIVPVRVALTPDQIERYALPPIMQAKATSSRYEKFVNQHGDDVFELEALPPETLQQIVREAIEGVMDRAAFEAEIAAEREDAGFLEGVRRTVCETLRGIDLEDSDE